MDLLRPARVVGLAIAIGALAACGAEAGEPFAPAPPPASTSRAPAPARSPVATSTPAGPYPDAPSATETDDPRAGAPYPIVLAHGMGGFAKLGRLPVEYFNDVEADLRAAGETDVFVTTVAPYASSEVRARALADQIDAILRRTGKHKVNLIGHSQGGLDARVVASPGGLARGDRVASITTVSTPHAGSWVADVALGAITRGGLLDEASNALLQLLERTVYDVQTDADLRAQLENLSEKYMRDVFNPRYVDDARVTYESYAGRSNRDGGAAECVGGILSNDPSKVDATQLALAPTGALLARTRGANDGMVPVTSARWGTFVGCVPADHGKEIGQPLVSGPDPLSGFEHKAFWRSVVARVRAQKL